MTLHFNLKQVFVLCLLLMAWQHAFSGTWWLATAQFGAIAAYMRQRGKKITAADIVFTAAFLMNLWYILRSWGNVRQYDYFNFAMHADYFVRNGFFWHNPAGYLAEAYFQPPLWGLVSALVTKTVSFDAVRFLSLFCVSGTAIIFWRLAGEFRLKENVRVGIFALFCFFPANTIAANLVNNDAMVYFLMTAAVYIGYRWYVFGSWRDALILSGLLLAAGMAKLSGLMLVPALGTLGLFRLAQAKDKIAAKIWGQFIVIGVGAMSGFAWGFFLLYHNLPLVPPPVETAFQDMRGYGLAERLFGWQYALLPFADIRAGMAEPNVWLALVKTSLFGEWSWQGTVWAYLMYGTGAVLALLLVGSFLALPFYKLGEGWGFNAFAIVLAFSVIAAWGNFWLDYPYFCSSEYRYVMILLPVSLLWLGNLLSQKSLPKALMAALAGGLSMFIAAKFMLYLNTI